MNNRLMIAAMMMQGAIAKGGFATPGYEGDMADECLKHADAMISAVGEPIEDVASRQLRAALDDNERLLAEVARLRRVVDGDLTDDEMVQFRKVAWTTYQDADRAIMGIRRKRGGE